MISDQQSRTILAIGGAMDSLSKDIIFVESARDSTYVFFLLYGYFDVVREIMLIL